MPVEDIPEILPDELAQIVISVFETMMGLEAVECNAPEYLPVTDSRARSQLRLSSTVRLSGDWQGIVLLECGQAMACRLASRYLRMGDADCDATSSLFDVGQTRQTEAGAVTEVVLDVLGELANMIGGNVKSVLNRGLVLSMPVVVESSADSSVCDDHEVTQRLAFHSSDGVFFVTILRPHS